ncbi:PREDICTED: uncharacterized protein LOC106910694 [Poecilia mexicana]|uniref:uncharacterized protein LOC106910694 n=1 Tax=Poecilia mexicana TaxID=48701 RepID=UPI00072E9942|nr:PREDICTED: uncharacterized protein LOC106910694 [Poecilia mexicana]
MAGRCSIKAFASKAAAVLSRSGQRLDWSILDTEILIMLTHAVTCNLCGSSGHQSSFCPSLPFKANRSTAAPSHSIPPLLPTDRHGRTVQPLRRSPPQVSLPPPPVSNEKPSRFQALVSRHLSTPIHVSVLASLLQFHPDRTFVNFLISGLSQGFLIGAPQSPFPSLSIPNLQSALQEPAVVSSLLQKEVSKGYAIGPFRSPTFFIALIPSESLLANIRGKNG